MSEWIDVLCFLETLTQPTKYTLATARESTIQEKCHEASCAGDREDMYNGMSNIQKLDIC